MKYRTSKLSALAAVAALLCAPVRGFAQSILRTSGNYTVLGGTLISVGGPGPNTFTNGNIGLYPAATTNITGFNPPATVAGITLAGTAAAIIATGPSTTGQAMADLQVAHTGLAGMASNVNLSNRDLATVGPLAPGVYTFDGTAGLTGALILDAQGKNNVYWVFQIGTTLTTAANSTVTLINAGTNGGGDDGIFWNAGAAINVGNNNTILGNYIAGTSISFTGSTSTAGNGGTRALALAAVTFAGPGSMNALGSPGSGDWTGGLTLNGSAVVPTAPASSAAAITTAPANQNAVLGGSATFSAAASGSPATFTYAWKKGTVTLANGGNISGATSATLQISNLSAADAGNYTVTVSNGVGTPVTSAAATLTLGSGTTVAPVITNTTLTTTGTVGTAFTFPITTSGSPTSYTATGLPAGLTIDPLTGAITGTATASGTYQVVVNATNSAGTSTATVTMVISAAPGTSSRIMAFAARSQAGTGNQTLIVGFAVAGNNKTLLLRGLGLAGSPNALGDPLLSLYNGNTSMASNDDWGTGGNTAQITSLTTQVGLTQLAAGSKDSALVAVVNSGVYTTRVTGANGSTGTALAQVYDADSSSASRLFAVAARMQVEANDGILIAGITIAGNASKTVLIRGVGPGLAAFGVTGFLADPQIAMFSGSTVVASNDNWEAGTNVAQLTATSAQVGEFPLTAGSKDAAMLVTLQPGSYTVQLSGVGGTTGIALIEIYDTQ